MAVVAAVVMIDWGILTRCLTLAYPRAYHSQAGPGVHRRARVRFPLAVSPIAG